MSELVLKYNLLDEIGQQEVDDFIDFLLNKGRKKQEKRQEENPQEEETFMEKYRKNLLEISVWTEEEVAVFEENRK